MASPFQQQALRRKLIYIGSILVLFTAAFLWRNNSVAEQARNLALREQDRGDVELIGSVIRLSLTGLRGFVTCSLWWTAIDKQKKNQWNELEVLVRSVSKLQPHFITPWLFQSWNLAYNVSVEADRVRDKYFYVARGINLLAEGERLNQNNPDVRFWIGFYNQHKICKSDETNVQRSLFQLSLIPPNERDPARFKQMISDKEEINLVEFEKFCRKNPQLIRRLKEGMMRDTLGEARRQFTCATPADVIQFLADNQRVPSLYEDVPPVAIGQWQEKPDKLAPLADRFPPLPPKREPAPPQHLYDRQELTAEDDTKLGDSVDGYVMARAWFGYAQEPIPDPDKDPGSTKPITDRTRQRNSKKIANIIFRNYPAIAQSNLAERLQQEGWFDNELWLITGWFPKDRFSDGSPSRIGNDRVKWSLEAWTDAYNRWRRNGEENHLLFESPDKEANMNQLAKQFDKDFDLGGRQVPTELRTDNMDERTKEEYLAARYLALYQYNRQLSNFPVHINRAFVEQKEETVEGRKAFYQAERLRWAGSIASSLQKYAAALPYWRDKVLLKNKDFRRDDTIQEESYDWQYRYMRLYHDQNGVLLKRRLGEMAHIVPLLPTVNPDDFGAWILKGPLDITDEEGVPLYSERAKNSVVGRKPGMQNKKPEKPKSSGS